MMRRWPAAGLAITLLLAAPGAADPRIDYTLHCRGCHGPDGGGVAGAAPSFRGHLAKFLRVPGGRAYLVQVPGTAQSELDDEHVAVLLNWLLEEFSPNQIPPDFVPYNGREVTGLRRTRMTDVVAVRAELMRAIAALPESAAPPSGD